jgi:hypothetical protein
VLYLVSGRAEEKDLDRKIGTKKNKMRKARKINMDSRTAKADSV